jgi:hypothetical protein
MKRVALILLLAIVSTFLACSYLTDFVVVNDSPNPIELRYKVKSFPGPFAPRITPAKMTASQLHAEDHAWTEMDSGQYSLDSGTRTVTLRLMPKEALRIERLQRAGMRVDETDDAKSFSIEEISIIGTNGKIEIEGELVRKSFVVESKNTYILTYK